MLNSNDWRSSLTQDTRNKVVERILDTLQRKVPGRNDLYSIAARFEEITYSQANNQHEYLKKISLKMLNLETRKQDEPLETYLLSGSIPKEDHEICANSHPKEDEMQEIVWTKMQALQVEYLNDLKELCNLLELRCQQPMPPQKVIKLSHYKTVLQRMITYLCAPKGSLPKELTMDKMEALERKIINIMEAFKRSKQLAEHQTFPPAIGSQNLEAYDLSVPDLENWMANLEINE